jgi:hypothetical protein
MSRAADEHHTRAIRDHEVSWRHRNVCHRDRHVRAGLHDSSARGARRAASREQREPVALRLVDIASRAFDDDTGNAPQLCGPRQVATPTRSLAAASLLDHDDVTRLPRLDRRRPQVTRSHWAPVVGLELHCHHAA